MKPWRSLLLCAGPVLAALVLGCEDGPPRLVEGRADMALIPALEIRGDDMTPGKPILTYFASYFGYSCKASATLGVGDPGEEDVDGDLVGHFAHAGVVLLIPFDRQRRSGLSARLGLAGYGYQRFEYDYSGGHDWLKDEGGRGVIRPQFARASEKVHRPERFDERPGKRQAVQVERVGRRRALGGVSSRRIAARRFLGGHGAGGHHPAD